jgi:hypothetical protein
MVQDFESWAVSMTCSPEKFLDLKKTPDNSCISDRLLTVLNTPARLLRAFASNSLPSHGGRWISGMGGGMRHEGQEGRNVLLKKSESPYIVESERLSPRGMGSVVISSPSNF